MHFNGRASPKTNFEFCIVQKNLIDLINVKKFFIWKFQNFLYYKNLQHFDGRMWKIQRFSTKKNFILKLATNAFLTAFVSTYQRVISVILSLRVE